MCAVPFSQDIEQADEKCSKMSFADLSLLRGNGPLTASRSPEERTMEKGILNEVIEAEKDIQVSIEQEQARLRETLECVRREAEASVAAAERELSASRERDLDVARQEAEARARKVVEEASGRVHRLERIDDDTLTGVIMKRLPRILME